MGPVELKRKKGFGGGGGKEEIRGAGLGQE